MWHAILCSDLIPTRCLEIAFWNAISAVVTKSNRKAGIWIFLIRSEEIEPTCFGVVAWNPRAEFVESREFVLRSRKSRDGCFVEPCSGLARICWNAAFTTEKNSSKHQLRICIATLCSIEKTTRCSLSIFCDSIACTMKHSQRNVCGNRTLSSRERIPMCRESRISRNSIAIFQHLR